MFSISGNVRLNIYILYGRIRHRSTAMKICSIAKNLIYKVIREVTVGTTIGKESENVKLLVVICLFVYISICYFDVVSHKLENVDAHRD